MEEQRSFMNIVIIGHVGSGTTALEKRLTCQSISIDQQQINKEKVPSFVTIHHLICIQPRPQHRDFIQSSFSPSSKVDCVLLVVSAAVNEFETSIGSNGQICEQLIMTMHQNLKHVLVAVNKMDVTDPPYSEERYYQIKMETTNLLKKVGYRSKTVSFVPISCHDDENLFRISKRMPWYHDQCIVNEPEINDGKTLLQAFDTIVLPLQPIQKPLRLPVKDIFHIGRIGTVVTGRVETGILRKDMLINFVPSNITTRVVSIENDEKLVDQAVPGDNVGFQISSADATVIRRGDVCSNVQNHAALPTASFVAKIIVVNGSRKIEPGFKAILSCHTVEVHCKLIALLRKIDRRTSRTIELSPASIKVGDSAVVKIIPEKFVCIETFTDYPALGRFVIRELQKTIAVGTVEEVEKIPITE